MSHLLQNNKRKSNEGGRNLSTFQNELLSVGGGQKILPPRPESTFDRNARNQRSTKLYSNDLPQENKQQSQFIRQRTNTVTPIQKHKTTTSNQRRFVTKQHRPQSAKQQTTQQGSQQQQQQLQHQSHQQDSTVMAEGKLRTLCEHTKRFG